ncbi:hypothetical protein EC973_003898 [Apophysomyces ossiformis]|uniref:FAD dependent oxidoreductase domain-containing protein n=1 Tax=Apophysomyces ossiformis TaxID=679940 RepID=A0A8H7EM30_9FUNG|nr:hypothetical protein EC973_003898 [Apophysomyces ossiformis]
MRSGFGHVVVIGAGVTGLTAAIELKKRGHNVVVVAKCLPGDEDSEYTSLWAGAHWRTVASNNDIALQRMDSVSYNTFMELSSSSPQETGVMKVLAYDYYNYLTPETENPWFQSVVRDFEFIEKCNLPPRAKVGHKYVTVVINAPHYLKWLLGHFVQLGGSIKRQTITDISDVFSSQVAAVVNCTGLGSRQLVPDDTVYLIRGQTVIVKAPHINRTLTHIGEGMQPFTYVIPRSNGLVVLGGTYQVNNYNAAPDDQTAESILARAKKLCPELTELGELEVVKHAIGFRPCRKNGVRIENELREYHNNGKVMTIPVTHAYGHGGFGYQCSWGGAKVIADLVEKGSLNKPKL